MFVGIIDKQIEFLFLMLIFMADISSDWMTRAFFDKGFLRQRRIFYL